MPLQPGDSRATISHNISELTHHGSRPRSHAQIVAIALSSADRSKRADGGPAGKPPDDESTRMHDTSRFWTGPRPYVDPRSQQQRDEEYQKRRDTDDALARRWLDQLPHADGGPAVNAALRIAQRDAGGYTPPAAPFFERQEARATTQSPYGFAAGVGLGRHDKNDVSVGAGSYVLPSDVVAGLGDGNSLAGAHVFNQILNSMPWGVTAPRSTGHRGPPPPPHDAYLAQGITGTQKEPTLADGGEAKEVPIIMADGEYTLSPEQVLRIGQNYSPQRDLDNYPASHDRIMRRGHRVLDSFVKQTRGKTIKHLKELKGPVGSHDASKGHT